VNTIKRLLLKLAIVIAVLLIAIVIALPFVLPTVVERMVSKFAAEYGLIVDSDFDFGYCWRNGPGVEGSLRISVPGSVWRPQVKFAASACEWEMTAALPYARFDEHDSLLRKLVEDHPIAGVSNLTFSGALSLSATARRTFSMPVPVWSVKAPIENVCVSAVKDGHEMSLSDLSVKLGASGIASHYDIDPMFLRVGSLARDRITLSNLTAAIRATERALMVNEATAGFCGGRVSVYSLFLDPKRLNAGFTLFLDEVEAGEALRHINGFRGEASGHLHGCVKAYVREAGSSVRLKDAFLYSTPGQTGRLRVYDSEAVAENLALAGLDSAARQNVANALADMDYSVLRLDLERGDGNTARLSVQLKGSVERGGVTVPVDLTLNLNGELEQLINTGLGYSNKLKGKNK